MKMVVITVFIGTCANYNHGRVILDGICEYGHHHHLTVFGSVLPLIDDQRSLLKVLAFQSNLKCVARACYSWWNWRVWSPLLGARIRTPAHWWSTLSFKSIGISIPPEICSTGVSFLMQFASMVTSSRCSEPYSHSWTINALLKGTGISIQPEICSTGEPFLKEIANMATTLRCSEPYSRSLVINALS